MGIRFFFVALSSLIIFKADRNAGICVSRVFMPVADESFKVVFIVGNGHWTSPEYRFRLAEL